MLLYAWENCGEIASLNDKYFPTSGADRVCIFFILFKHAMVAAFWDVFVNMVLLKSKQG